MTTKVVVVDDQELVRAGFVALLASSPDLDIVGEAGQGEEAVRLVAEQLPDVVLMDVRMPVLDGIEATKRILADPRCAHVRVIVLITFAMDEYAFGALRAGAVGFLVKDTPPAELLRAVQVAAAGDALLSPSVTKRLIEAFASTPTRNPPDPPPTSPHANATSSCSSHGDSPTQRSRTNCTWASRPSRPTSADCSRSSA